MKRLTKLISLGAFIALAGQAGAQSLSPGFSAGIYAGPGGGSFVETTPITSVPNITASAMSWNGDYYCSIEAVSGTSSGPSSVAQFFLGDPNNQRNGIWYRDPGVVEVSFRPVQQLNGRFTSFPLTQTATLSSRYSSILTLDGNLVSGTAAATQTVTITEAQVRAVANADFVANCMGSSATTSAAPTSLVATPSDGQVSVAFTAPTDDGGAAITDYEYQLGSGSWTSASTTSSPVVISGLTNGNSYSIKLRAVNSAGNGAESGAVLVDVDTPSPASEFAKYEQEVQQVLVDEASRSLRSSVSANQRMTQSARSRFISARQTQAREEDVTRALIPFDVDGNFTLSETGLSSAGNFFQQVGNEEGTYRRLFFGDFDVQHDNDTDSTTATLTGRMAWEQMTSEQTMLGYFIGGELATSTIGGSFEGDQDRIGVTAGGYIVHELSEQVYFDGFASVGAGRNNLEMANDTLALESEYTTQTATLGGAITGVYSQKGYDFKPELAFSYGKTWLGDIGFTGRAYGLVDNTLSLDAGDVSIASLTFRPEVIIPIGADFVADTNTQLSFAPRLVCEQIKSTTKTSDCGTGGELGFSSTSEDGLSSADMRVLLDRINGGTRSSFAFSVEHKF